MGNFKKQDLLDRLMAHKGLIIKGLVLVLLLSAGFSAYMAKLAKDKEGTLIVSEALGVEDEATGDVGKARGAQDDYAQAGEGATGDEAKALEAVAETIVVDVTGAVKSPAVLVLPAGSRLYEAIEGAGGLTEDADVRNINRAVELHDGDRVYVPSREEVKTKAPLPPHAGADASTGLSGAGGAAPGGAGEGQQASAKININTAASQELQALNGVGPATAEKIIAYRQKNGGFKKIDDIKKVSGIGAKTYEKLKDMITV